MIAIIALGNPGIKYEKTRHNLGRIILDFWIKAHDLAEPSLNKKLKSNIEKSKLHEREIIFGYPETFMNESGRAVKLICDFYKIKPENLWIVHDDLDIKLGGFKIVQGRGSAGHHGIESVMDEINSKNFNRLRVGIQPSQGKPKDPENFVVQNFTEQELAVIVKNLPLLAETIDEIIGRKK